MTINQVTKGMNKTVFGTKEELMSFLEGYIVELQLGDKAIYALSPDILQHFGEAGKSAKAKKQDEAKSFYDDVEERIRMTIKEALNDGSSVYVNGNRYVVTTFGDEGRNILKSFIDNKPDEVDDLITSIGNYYKRISAPKTINNYFKEGLYKDYKEYLTEVSTYSFELK